MGDRLKSTGKLQWPWLILFLKGVAMGAADIVPGVSGGTVAFITGIYENLIEAIRSINLKVIMYFFKGFFNKKYFRKSWDLVLSIHFNFLIPLILGIASAFVFLANIIGPFRENYPTYSAAFFLGLVLASAIVVGVTMKEWKSYRVLFGILLGFVMGFGVVGLEAIQTSHSYLVIFFSGVITVCAMILPGISGAFILWFLGQYDFMLGELQRFIHLDGTGLVFILIYILGGLVGILSFSRLLSFLLHHYRIFTLSFLLGLMLGALRKPGDVIIKTPENLLITFGAVLSGILLVIIFWYLSLKKDVLATSRDNG
ncbi:MAG: DUF368 domain-containing protein [Candidatus Thermoplasmatota archaeon]|nr:DUF368 domain-containing protein [Candidatus Thermoplasmatota archaeon]